MADCEWNPEENREAYNDDKFHAKSEFTVGNGRWHLCDRCALLPRFRRYKKERITFKKMSSYENIDVRLNGKPTDE